MHSDGSLGRADIVFARGYKAGRKEAEERRGEAEAETVALVERLHALARNGEAYPGEAWAVMDDADAWLAARRKGER